MELNTMNVREIVLYLMFKKDELICGQPEVNPIYVAGVFSEFKFHPSRVKEKEEDIKVLLKQLPHHAKCEPGKLGGVTLSHLCFNDKSVQWGTSVDADFLLCMGLAIKKVVFPVPREMWRSLPKGLPYVTVHV